MEEDMEVDSEAFLPWYSRSKKQQERWVAWSLWTGTVVCFLVGIAWVLSMKMSSDSYFVLSPWGSWRSPLEQEGNLKEGFNVTSNQQGNLREGLNVTSNQQGNLREGLNVTSNQQGNLREGFNVTNIPEGGQDKMHDADDHQVPAEVQEFDDGYFIQKTGVRGRKAVKRFQAHVACLSDSGRWVYDPKPRKLPWLAVKMYNWVLHCDKEHTRHRRPADAVMGEMADSIALSNGSAGTWSVREELKWVWQTNDSNCPWRSMDRDDFCRQIGSNRNVLVVGDSINQEISVAIQNALTMNISSAVTQQLFAGEELCTDVLGGAGNGFSVRFVRNDYLSPVVNSTSWNRNFQDPWIPQLDNGEGDTKILVLNRGAHYQDDRSLVEGLRTTFSILRDRHPDMLVIYRNTPPGHVNCTSFHAPIPKPLMQNLPVFHWEDFERQNQLAKSIVEEFHYVYVDVARAIGMRPEGHMHSRDCLHYCQPGPLDLAVDMIYNVLLLLQWDVKS